MTSAKQQPTKKQAILDVARALGVERFTAAEVEQIRRQMMTQMGEAGQTSPDYIVAVLQEARLRVVIPPRSDTAGRYEEEFHDLLHFSTLEEAEVCLVRLDELWRKFRSVGDSPAAERVLEVARLGHRRAEMISRNKKVEPAKRATKEEVARWFVIWLETPDAFFDWLDVRKQSADFQSRFAVGTTEGE